MRSKGLNRSNTYDGAEIARSALEVSKFVFSGVRQRQVDRYLSPPADSV